MSRRMLYIAICWALLSGGSLINAVAQTVAPKPPQEGRTSSAPRGAAPSPTDSAGTESLLTSLELSPEQRANLDKLRKRYAPKVLAARDKLNTLLAEQEKLATKGAKEPAKLLQMDKDIASVKEELRTIQLELRAKFTADLTPQQREKLKAGMEKIQNAR